MISKLTNVLFFCLLTTVVFAKPEGMQVVAGSAGELTLHGKDNWVIESGKKTILEWDQFSLANHETITFQQADFQSAVLNRIVGGESTELLGQLLSNGSVFVINPNGVLIGPNARIETASFIASSLDVLNEEFLNKTSMLFSGNSQSSVINLGTIACPAGNIVLLGRVVKNEGALLAESGRVAMGASSEILLKLDGSSSLIRPALANEPVKEGEETSIINEGEIEALMVELKSSGNPYTVAIQQKGLIDVSFADENAGFVEIISEDGIAEVTGTILATSSEKRGGTVHLLGEKVGVLENGYIDASGALGGGTILIGGDYKGENPEIKNANITSVGYDVLLKADATHNGDGGKIIVWSDFATRGYASFTARGGEFGGDGGFVEVSGKNLDFQGTSDTSALFGKTGTILFDPTDITITGTSAPTNGSFSAAPYVWTSTSNPVTIPATTHANSVQTLLGSNNVTISTSSGSGGTGNLTVSTAFTWSTTNKLTLNANGRLAIDANITNTSASTGDLVMDFQNIVTIASTGGVKIGSGITVSTVGENMKFVGIAGAVGNQEYGFTLGISGTLETTNGQIDITGTGGSNGLFCFGVELEHSSTLRSTGTGSPGTITITGTGGSQNNALQVGVRFAGFPGNPGPTVSVVDADLDVIGNGGPNPTDASPGVLVQFTSTLTTTGTGDITITGTSPGGRGVEFQRAVSILATNTGSITVTGNTGASTSTSSFGVFFNAGDQTQGPHIIRATGAGAISFSGTAQSNAGNDSYGVFVQDVLGNATNTGTINVTGTALGSGTSAQGVRFDFSASLGTIVAGSGTVNITGTGSSSGSGAANHGVISTGAIQHNCTTGTIAFDGIVGAGTTYGLLIEGTTPRFTSTGAGTFTFNAVQTAQAFGLNTCNFTLGAGTTVNVNSPLTLLAAPSFSLASGAATYAFTSTVNGTFALSLPSGAGGAVTFGGIVGASSALAAITVGTSGKIPDTLSIGANITAASFVVTGASATTLAGTATIDTSASNGVITFGSTIEGTSAGAQGLTLTSGSGQITIPADIGAVTRLGAFALTSTTAVTLPGTTIRANSATITPPITLSTGTCAIDTSEGNGIISFGALSTINGALALTLTSGSGAITFSAAVGGTTPLSALSATCTNTLTQSSTAETTGTFGYTGTTISLAGNVTTAGGTITMTGPVALTAAVSFDSTNAGGTAAGAAVNCTAAVTGAQTFTVRAGTAGTITFSGDLGTSGTRLTSLTLTSGVSLTLGAGVDIFVTNTSLTIPMATTASGDSIVDTGSL